MNPLVIVLIVGAVAQLGRSRSRSRPSTPRTPRAPRYPVEPRPLTAVRWTARGLSRDAYAVDTWRAITAALPATLRHARERALVGAALVALAARETGWGRYERNGNFGSVHATGAQPRVAAGDERLRAYASRDAGALDFVRLVTGDGRYEPAFESLRSSLDAGDAPDVAIAEWVQRIEAAGYSDPRPASRADADREEMRSIAAGVLARLRRKSSAYRAAVPAPTPTPAPAPTTPTPTPSPSPSPFDGGFDGGGTDATAPTDGGFDGS